MHYYTIFERALEVQKKVRWGAGEEGDRLHLHMFVLVHTFHNMCRCCWRLAMRMMPATGPFPATHSCPYNYIQVSTLSHSPHNAQVLLEVGHAYDASNRVIPCDSTEQREAIRAAKSAGDMYQVKRGQEGLGR